MTMYPLRWLGIVAVGLCSVMIFQLPQAKSLWQQATLPILLGTDQVYHYTDDGIRFFIDSIVQPKSFTYIETLEKENRILQAHTQTLAIQLQKYAQLEKQLALEQPKKKTPVLLSKDTKGWMLLQTQSIPVQGKRAVYFDGIFIGSSVEQNSRIELLPLWETVTPVLVQHKPSGKVGLLSKAERNLVVEFFENTKDVKEGDIFVSVANGQEIPDAAVIGKAVAIDTKDSHPTTRVFIEVSAQPKVGDVVFIDQ